PPCTSSGGWRWRPAGAHRHPITPAVPDRDPEASHPHGELFFNADHVSPPRRDPADLIGCHHVDNPDPTIAQLDHAPRRHRLRHVLRKIYRDDHLTHSCLSVIMVACSTTIYIVPNATG